MTDSQNYLIVAWWRYMVTYIWDNIGSSNGLLPNGTTPLPRSIVICEVVWHSQEIYFRESAQATFPHNELEYYIIITRFTQPHVPGTPTKKGSRAKTVIKHDV